MKVLPTVAMNKSPSSLNQLESSSVKVDGNIMLPPTPTALSNITKSPFALLLSGKEDQSALDMDEEDYTTESTMDDNEVRRLAFFNDSDTTNMSIMQDNSNNPIKRHASSEPIFVRHIAGFKAIGYCFSESCLLTQVKRLLIL